MTITAKIIADSVSTKGCRITTFVLKYPRWIHSEFMTHRVFSRNASSSRAIPVAKMIQQVKEDPAMPVHWGKNQPGMQAREELGVHQIAKCQSEWLELRDEAVYRVERLTENGLHKQVANRLLEPWMHIQVVATATDLENFFSLRLHKDAQPEFQELARQMARAFLKSTPRLLECADWHLPFVRDEERGKTNSIGGLKISVARCARVSYLLHDGTEPSIEKDIELHDKLVVQVPLHASPAEHQAKALNDDFYIGNFRGWLQYRKTLQGENIIDFPWTSNTELYSELMAEETTCGN
jgi:hypothetical protein